MPTRSKSANKPVGVGKHVVELAEPAKTTAANQAQYCCCSKAKSFCACPKAGKCVNVTAYDALLMTARIKKSIAEIEREVRALDKAKKLQDIDVSMSAAKNHVRAIERLERKLKRKLIVSR